MARIQHIAPTPVSTTKAAALSWDFGEGQWAQKGAYVDADYPEPEGDERLFYTIAVMVGRKRNITACIDVLAVTRDFEHAIERRLPATINEDYQVQLRDHDTVPAGFARPAPEDSTVPEYRYEQYAQILEHAHGLEPDLEGGA